jgi:8-oxo-dGTP diphosphatase
MKRPGVGLAVILMKNHEVLVGKRKGSHGAGKLSFPGGHLESNETFYDCVVRELYEETGLDYQNYNMVSEHPCALTNDILNKDNKHYVTLFMGAKYRYGDIENKEPKKCEGWEWMDWDELVYETKGKVFLPIKNLIKQGYDPFNGLNK